ncbi:MAG: HAMP domain-containing sensor histidine kinase [Pseudomonadota bacterium]
MRVQAASALTAIASQRMPGTPPAWQVIYTAAAAIAGAAIAIHLLLASAINPALVVLLSIVALAVVPASLSRRTDGRDKTIRSSLVGHQALVAVMLYALVAQHMYLMALPAFVGVMALAAQSGRTALLASASVLIGFVVAQSAGLPLPLAGLHGDLLSWGHVILMSSLVAVPGLATYAVWYRQAVVEHDAGQVTETRSGGAADRILNSLPQLVLQHNRTGNVTAVYGSKSSAPLARCEGLLGGGLFARVHVADRPALLHALDRARHHPGIHQAEIRVCEPQDTAEPQSPSNPSPAPGYRWLELRANGDLGDRDGSVEPLVYSTLRDIHDHKVREEALELARREAEVSNASKTRFLASVSHELRTPLNAIIGFSELLKMEPSSYEPMTSEKRIEYASLISDSGLHLLDVVNHILDATKIEAGRFEIQCEVVDLRPVVHSAVEMIQARASANQSMIDVQIDDDLPGIVADGRAMKQILLNLLSNAVKFSFNGEPVELRLKQDEDQVAIHVVDKGIGIAPDDLSRIGEPFFRAGDVEGLQTAGTGLGLSVVKGLVALHGGKITIASASGEGTQVSVSLPIAGPSIQDETAEETDEKITALALRPAEPVIAEAEEQAVRKVG